MTPWTGERGPDANRQAAARASASGRAGLRSCDGRRGRKFIRCLSHRHEARGHRRKVKCLRAGKACSARYQAAYKRYGFICVSGHLRKRTTAPPPPPEPPAPPPTPPPAPPAQAGHYHGTTTQLETFDFDVTADGTRVVNLSTGQINEGCTPPGHLYGGNFHNGFADISAAGDFKIDINYTGFVGSDPSTGRFTITGHFNGPTATGTLSDSTNFVDQGVGPPERAPQVGLEPTTLRLTAGCSAN